MKVAKCNAMHTRLHRIILSLAKQAKCLLNIFNSFFNTLIEFFFLDQPRDLIMQEWLFLEQSMQAQTVSME